MKTNNELQEDVMNELAWEPALKGISSQIGVTTKDGVVTLSGNVDSFYKKLAAERAAQRVYGVKVVAEELEIRLPGLYSKRTDTDIAEALANVIKWNSALSDKNIKARVEDAWVYLEGMVDFEFQRKYAERIAQNLTGVKGVSNAIKLKSSVKQSDISLKIAEAFQRSATIDSANIKVETGGNTVTLKGTVRSYAEKHEAERAAWAAPGVLSVKNLIQINVPVYA